MKKLASSLVIALFLSIPVATNATLLGTGQLQIEWSSPYAFGYYGDYDGTVTSSTFGYTTDMEEIFCVSSDNAQHVENDITFYSIDSDLGDLSRAAWIADNWTSYSYNVATTQDDQKVAAQSAIWKIIGVISPTAELTGDALGIYNVADQIAGYTTDNWYYADSSNYQDYLTPVPLVPEPSTLLLLGFGLFGLGLVRKNS